MEITKKEWYEIVSFLKASNFTIEEVFYNFEDLDNCRIIANHSRFTIRIHFEYENLRLDLDDECTNFSSYYTPIEQIDPKFFYLLHQQIITKLNDRY